MNYAAFFLLQLKRICKNTRFLLLLLLFPVCLFALSRSFSAEEDSRIPVGLCIETEDTLAQTLCRKLVDSEDSLFRFFLAPSAEELTRLVQSGRAECGYLFRKPLQEELDKRHQNNLITVLVSENTTCKSILNELVYANLFEEYALSLLKDSLHTAAHLPFTEEAAAAFLLPPVTDKEIERSYRSHLRNGDTFSFEINFITADVSAEYAADGSTSVSLPVFRGFTAVFLLLCGFLALLTVHADRKNGLYARLHGIQRPLCAFFTMCSALLPAAAVSLLGLAVSGCFTGVLREFTALLCYFLCLIAFYALLGTLIRNHTMLCAAFPMLLLCSLVFTPVFVDISAFFPWAKVIRYALPTYYYLLFF